MTTPHDPGTDPTASHDPGVSPESEGIPDLQDGTPEQQRANDPQQESVPGDLPAAVLKHGTTPAEAREGESLDQRLAEEEPEPDPVALAEGQGAARGGRSDLAAGVADAAGDEAAAGDDVPEDATAAYSAAEPPAGLLLDEPDPDQPRNQDVYSQEGSTDGLSAEEEAVHITGDDQALDPEREDERILRDESV